MQCASAEPRAENGLLPAAVNFGRMPTDALSLFLLLGSSALTFLVARRLSARWRERRRRRSEEAARAAESRQVRRARERRRR